MNAQSYSGPDCTFGAGQPWAGEHFFWIDHSSWSRASWDSGLEDHHIIFLIKTVTDALRARDRVCWPLYRYLLRRTSENVQYAFLFSTRNGPPQHYIHLTEYQNTYIIDIVTKLCGHTTVGEKMFREVGGNCGYFYAHWCRHSRTTICNGRRYYPGWKPKMNQQHQITTALDLIEMAIQDVVSPDVTVAKCVDVHSFLTAWVTIHGSMRLSNGQDGTHDGLLRRHRTPTSLYTE
jgi:hypothetical protein